MAIDRLSQVGVVLPGAPGPGAASPGPRQGPAVPGLADQADIRALSLPVALQILATEILAAWALPPAAQATLSPPPASADAAALRLVDAALQALPDPQAGAAAWAATLERLQVGLAHGTLRATAALDAWRDVPPPASAAIRAVQELVGAVLGPENLAVTADPRFIEPGWALLAPRLERYRRARRWVRRRLLDPDADLPPLV